MYVITRKSKYHQFLHYHRFPTRRAWMGSQKNPKREIGWIWDPDLMECGGEMGAWGPPQPQFWFWHWHTGKHALFDFGFGFGIDFLFGFGDGFGLSHAPTHWYHVSGMSAGFFFVFFPIKLLLFVPVFCVSVLIIFFPHTSRTYARTNKKARRTTTQ